ncbi:hypothetical protein [Propionivibrio limicola]|uniref:hypothetical protein n=1 Tax=Propionivibrio limicola TaxID=167645 RepID=UPI00129156EF|nr:hypothetical protein [Propionivibrio limicola]
MKINKTPKAFFTELTMGSERYECDSMSGKLRVKGEYGIGLWLRKDQQPPYKSTLLFQVNQQFQEVFVQLSDKKYSLEHESEGHSAYLVMDSCPSVKEFIETALEALAVLDKAVMIRRMAISCDTSSSED